MDSNEQFILTDAVEFLKSIVCNMVSLPKDVNIVSSEDDRGFLLTLTVAIDDMGKVIGKNGETANSIRKIVRAFGVRNGKKISMKIID